MSAQRLSSRSPRPPRARWGVFLCPVLLGVPGCSAEVEAERTAVDPRVEAPSEGEVLYRTACSTCHGESGLGDGPVASTLPVRPANIIEHLGDHSYEEIVRRVSEGIPPAMPPAQMTQDQVRQVMSYIWGMVPDSTRARLRALQITMEEDH